MTSKQRNNDDLCNVVHIEFVSFDCRNDDGIYTVDRLLVWCLVDKSLDEES